MATEEVKGKDREVLDRLKGAIVAPDVEGAREAAKQVLVRGVNLITAINYAIGGSSRIVEEKFDCGEYFLPHLVLAADAMAAAGEVLQEAMPREQIPVKKVVVIGTVEGDVHSVGKNIVAMMLKSSGFEVHDVGVDVKSSAFISRAREVNANLIALSSLMTTTMPYQREVIEDLKVMGLREQFKVMVGGGPVTESWADTIGADGYGRDASEALKMARELVGIE